MSDPENALHDGAEQNEAGEAETTVLSQDEEVACADDGEDDDNDDGDD